MGFCLIDRIRLKTVKNGEKLQSYRPTPVFCRFYTVYGRLQAVIFDLGTGNNLSKNIIDFTAAINKNKNVYRCCKIYYIHKSIIYRFFYDS
jgi:hypothetical protein